MSRDQDSVDTQQRPEVRLDPALQARIMARMRAEQASLRRTRRLRRYLLLPACVLGTGLSVQMSFSADRSDALVGSLVASSLLWFFWKTRRRLPGLFGLG